MAKIGNFLRKDAQRHARLVWKDFSPENKRIYVFLDGKFGFLVGKKENL